MGCLTFVNIAIMIVLIVLSLKTVGEQFSGRSAELRYYFSPGCGHCRRFTPQWDNEIVPKLSVAHKKIDTSDPANRQLVEVANQNGMMGVPFLLFIKNGRHTAFPMTTRRTISNVLAWVNSLI